MLRYLLSTLLIISAAQAEDCKPLKLLDRIQLEPKNDGRVEYIPVTVSGVRKNFLLDTGAYTTIVTEATADELKLKRYPSNVVAYSASGAKSQDNVRAPFAIGSQSTPSWEFAIYPGAREREWAGIVGAGMLAQWDVSLDFGKHTLDLVDQNHCDGRVVYWPERPIAIIPFRHIAFGTIIIRVKLDGKTFNALVDTGAPYSTLEQFTAKRNFGIVLGDAQTPIIGTLGGDPKLAKGSHRFLTLELEGLQVANPEFQIIPDAISAHINTPPMVGIPRFSDRSDQLDHDIILGMNVLKHLHIYIAYKERKLYITPASKPAEDPAK